MATDKNTKALQKQTVGLTSLRNLPMKVEVEQIDKRVTNVEKVVDTIQDISTSAFELLAKYFEKKELSEQRQLEIEDRQHKRAVYLISLSIAIIFILCMTSIFLNQVALVQYFINSGLAIAAGTGLSSLLKSGSKNKSKSNQE